jgi:TolB-like protein/DNA-binding winged helix-turn-helix (wHTH) protein/tetratricopeptide (TPR) repeat protein
MDASVAGETLEFDDWRFDTRAGDLLRKDPDGSWTPVPIGTRARDILAVLLQRPGALVGKDVIVDAVWPNVTVEPNNLTVQIAALRRILDDGRMGDSCIETVPGRGYRFVRRITRLSEADPEPPQADTAEPNPLPASPRWPLRQPWLWLVAGSCAIAVAALLAIAGWHGSRLGSQGSSPRLSLVVLPFQNLGNTTDDYLADGITDDLTTELSHIPDARVVARESAYTLKRPVVDVRAIGRQLGVRYAIEGGVRRLGTVLQVNARLVSTETGETLWSDRLDEAISEIAGGQEQIVTRMRDQLGISMVQIEAARSLRERPTNPDAFDLILRARAIRNLPPSPLRDKEALAQLERALTLDPNSVYAMTNVAFLLTDAVSNEDWNDFEKLRRAETLLTRARAMAPDSEIVLNTYVYWLRRMGRCPEAIEEAERALKTDPNRMRVMVGIYNELAVCKVFTGHAEEALALQQEADRLNPLSPWKFSRYSHMAEASLWLGRDQDAIRYFEMSFALNPELRGYTHWRYRQLAAAYALNGQMEEARRWLSKAERLWPYDTVRGRYPDDPSSAVFAAQVRRYQNGLRLAGLRDHADEAADFGVPADNALHKVIAGYTPKDTPGAKTIRTAELPHFLAASRPIVIDTLSYTWGTSIPGAVGLKFAGLGGSFSDEVQARLRSKMHALTAGDLNRPLVAVGWNSERFDGRNLALRLVALGYTRVYWYRGGREAWEVAGLPETTLEVQDW